jgi:glycerol kinase
MSQRKPYILAIDAGTTSSRAILFDHDGVPVSIGQHEFPQYFPQEGWVEHDPIDIWKTQRKAILDALEGANATLDQIHAIGVTNQRETTVLWDRATGEPVHRAIVWQDRRTAGVCDKLRDQGHAETFHNKTGLILDAYFSGTKIAWILDQNPELRTRAEAGELCFGTVDSWLIWHLTGGQSHVTDVTNASRTLAFNIHELQWDDELCDLLRIPTTVLPKVVSSSERCAHLDPASLGFTDAPTEAPTDAATADSNPDTSTSTSTQIPIAGIAGDQQAALFGQLCLSPGELKNTYGTGCFTMMNIGETPVLSEHNLLTTVAYQLGPQSKPVYALEGSIFVAGALVQWLRDQLEMITQSSDIEPLAKTVEHAGGVTFVPSLSGLAAPYWNPLATGALMGLTRGTEKGHIARAALEGIAHRVREVVELMLKDAGKALPGLSIPALKVDGGAAQNNLLMQIQADLLNAPVVRPQITELTAFGAAALAGLATGYWSSPESLQSIWNEERTFEPSPSEHTKRSLDLWQRRIQAVNSDHESLDKSSDS